MNGLLIAHATTLQANEVQTLEIVAVIEAKARIQELLRKHLYEVRVLAAIEAALELDLHHVSVGVAKQHVLGFDAVEFLLLLLALLDIAMEFAILGDGMSPELAATAGLLTNLQLDAFLFLVLR